MEPTVAFDGAAVIATSVVPGITDDQPGLPTPGSEWTVRDLLNHLVSGNLLTEAIVTGQAPPDRSADLLGADPKAAFDDSPARAATASRRGAHAVGVTFR